MPGLEGLVSVDPGAQITAGTGGFLILSGPIVENRGILRASEGQVSLQGGRLIAATRSTGAANSIDAGNSYNTRAGSWANTFAFAPRFAAKYTPIHSIFDNSIVVPDAAAGI